MLQVSDPVEEWVPGEFELPEYLHHSTNDSQVNSYAIDKEAKHNHLEKFYHSDCSVCPGGVW